MQKREVAELDSWLEKRRIALRNTPIGLRPKKQDKTRVLHHVPLLKD